MGTKSAFLKVDDNIKFTFYDFTENPTDPHSNTVQGPPQTPEN